MSAWLLLLPLLLAAAGLFLAWWGRRLHRQSGLPQGMIVYSDTGQEHALVEPIVSQRFGLVGKPDYLVEVYEEGRRQLVPMEVKSRRRPATPNIGHIWQLIAYCLIVEDVYGQRPAYGFLRYADATLRIDNSESLRADVLHAADEIRRARRAARVGRSHDEPERCAGCGYVDACGSESVATRYSPLSHS